MQDGNNAKKLYDAARQNFSPVSDKWVEAKQTEVNGLKEKFSEIKEKYEKLNNK